MPRTLISLRGGVIRDEARRFRKPVDFSLGEDEHIALIGPNGSGKTVLVETLTGCLYLSEGSLEYGFASAGNRASDNIRHITFRDTYGSADGDYYYQQRWNSSDREHAPFVSELLEAVAGTENLREELYRLMDIRPMLSKRIILLSSGELRKFQIVKMLLAHPEVLIIENPFIGLDAPTRELLTEVLGRLTRLSGLRLILVLSAPEDIPDFITHVYTVENRCCGPKQTLEDFRRSETFSARRERLRTDYAEGIELPPATTPPTECDEIAVLKNITIRYGKRTVFDGLDWTVRKGEKWALTGSNGSGKSTLLSLISADNPQAYAQDIALFGRQRGSGESIWEIKKHIGYVSPEMHRSYIKNSPAIDIVASGLFDTIGLYRQPTDAQRELCAGWLRTFGLEQLRDRSFVKLSSGEQRLLLLTRAFVKDPDLLIFDEPLHGLDCFNKERARAVIETFCRRPGKTLIYVTHYEHELPSCITRYKRLG